MKRKLIVLVCIFSLVAFGAFAGGSKSKPEAAAEKPAEKAPAPAPPKKYKITWSSVSVPEDAHTKAMFTFKFELERITDGQIEVEIYHSGQLFTQEGAQAAVKRGTLDMVYTGPNWIAQHVPKWSMFAAAYTFECYDHMSKFFNGPDAKPLYDEVAKVTGMRPLGAFYLGTRELNLRDIGREVRRPEDMKGVKLRMPNTPSWQFMGKALGANPTPISFTEVYMALKTGTVDGQDNPLPTDKNAKFYEVTKYIILTDHYINPVMPAINEKKWQSLGPELQQKVLQAIEAARQQCDSLNLKAEQELLDFFKDKGMVIIKPDKKAFIEYARKMYLENKEITKDWDMDLYEKVKSYAKYCK